MKTRKSTRAVKKKPTVADQNIDFEDDDRPLPASRTRDNDPDDDDFNPPSPANAEQDDEGSDAEEDLMELDDVPAGKAAEGNADSDFSGEEKPAPKRRAAPKVRAIPVVPDTGYLDITTARSTQFVQGFVGPFDRGVRGNALIRTWYGPDAPRIRQMLGRWYELSVLPPKVSSARGHDNLALRPWASKKAELEKASADAWCQRMKAAQSQSPFRLLSEAEAQPYNAMLSAGSLPTLIGAGSAQKDFHFTAGEAICLDSSGAPSNGDQDSDRANAGWLLDAGGIVPSLSWKPTSGKVQETDQILALAVISHSDQSIAQYEKESQQNPDFLKHGMVQIWAFPAEESDGMTRASRAPARCQRTLCFDRGRARKVQWSPVGGLLAVLCGDGSVSVVEPKEGGNGDYDLVERPVALLGLAPEMVKATAITWNSCNRLSVGYADGSIALWSVFPKRLLSRHTVHINHITEIASGYPTLPYVVATSPVGGPPKLVDLRSPSHEITESSTASVSTSSGVISYSDHLLGFHFPLPSANALSTVVGFSHYAYYPISRRISTPDSFITCLSAGRTHPYLLIGTVNGSLWALNPQCELFSSRFEVSDRLRVFQHEHRSAGLFKSGEVGSERGASRILQGFPKEGNPNPRGEMVKMAAAKKGAVNKKKGKGKAADAESAKESSKEVIHEPLTRVTTVQWNPNPGYGCWAAVAMGSGLVRVIDLGLEIQDPAD